MPLVYLLCWLNPIIILNLDNNNTVFFSGTHSGSESFLLFLDHILPIQGRNYSSQTSLLVCVYSIQIEILLIFWETVFGWLSRDWTMSMNQDINICMTMEDNNWLFKRLSVSRSNSSSPKARCKHKERTMRPSRGHGTLDQVLLMVILFLNVFLKIELGGFIYLLLIKDFPIHHWTDTFLVSSVIEHITLQNIHNLNWTSQLNMRAADRFTSLKKLQVK